MDRVNNIFIVRVTSSYHTFAIYSGLLWVLQTTCRVAHGLRMLMAVCLLKLLVTTRRILHFFPFLYLASFKVFKNTSDYHIEVLSF